MSEKPRIYLPPDGIAGRSRKEERSINEALTLCFSEGVGERALKYLRSITIERVNGPNIDPNHLMHQEGMRYLVGIIENRIKHGKENIPND